MHHHLLVAPTTALHGHACSPGVRTHPSCLGFPIDVSVDDLGGGGQASPYDAVDQATRSDRRVSSAVRAKVSPYEFRPTRAQYAVPHPPSVHAGPQAIDAHKVLERPANTTGPGGTGTAVTWHP